MEKERNVVYLIPLANNLEGEIMIIL